jgi:RHS repeat-associated protein
MTYDASNRLLTDSGNNVSHDAAGRLTSNPSATGGTATWEGRDWLASYTPTGGSPSSYSYNGLGQRLSRTQGGSTTRYVQDVNQSLPALLMENDASNVAKRHYIYGLGLLASIDSGGAATTYHFNHRGDTLALTNASQTITESYGYSAYGITAASNNGSNPFRFNGQFGVMDEENSLHFMRARYYAAGIGRFLSMDQVAGSAGDARSLNRFAFVMGNPASNIDPSGLFSIQSEIASLNGTLDNRKKMLASIDSKLGSATGSAKSGLLKKKAAYEQSISTLTLQIKGLSILNDASWSMASDLGLLRAPNVFGAVKDGALRAGLEYVLANSGTISSAENRQSILDFYDLSKFAASNLAGGGDITPVLQAAYHGATAGSFAEFNKWAQTKSFTGTTVRRINERDSFAQVTVENYVRLHNPACNGKAPGINNLSSACWWEKRKAKIKSFFGFDWK